LVAEGETVMIHLGKRTWRPYAAVTAAVLSLAVVLAVPGSAGAANKAAAAPRAAALAPSSSLIAPGDDLKTTSGVRGVTSDGRLVTGRFIPIASHINRHGRMIVRGTLKLVVDPKGAFPIRTSTVAGVPVQTVRTIPTTSTLSASSLTAAALPAGACNVLNLVLGPLDLDLLGLVVHLDKVVLNIIAQSGAGQLLGNLLCAVAHLLDGIPLSQQLAQISDLLNSILAILQQQ
jgi:hypothetical protein